MSTDRFLTLNTGSTGVTSDDGRRVEPSAMRNIDAISAILASYVPGSGHALEIASGSGQHIVRHACQFPGVVWQPSDVDPARIISIKSWVREAGVENVSEPLVLNAAVSGWSAQHRGYDIIIMVNLLHLISVPEAQTVIAESAKALNNGGRLLIYGPFMRGDTFASEGDERFHSSLAAQDRNIGYKSFQSVQDMQRASGLRIEATHDLPANNLTLVAQLRAETEKAAPVSRSGSFG